MSEVYLLVMKAARDGRWHVSADSRQSACVSCIGVHFYIIAVK